MVSAERVFQRVLAAGGAYAHYRAGKNITESNVRSCFNVIAVFNGACQIAADVFNGGDGVHIAHKVGKFGDITFKAVAERVKALISSVMCRYAFHQFRVFNAQYGEQVRRFQADFFVRFWVGNDAAGVGFTAGACRGADGNDWQRFIFNGLSFAGAACNVIP